jgi:hypothetical protein
MTHPMTRKVLAMLLSGLGIIAFAYQHCAAGGGRQEILRNFLPLGAIDFRSTILSTIP